MTQECVAGLAGGNVERTSFICKLRLELEARKHGKSGISQGHLKSFFTSSSLPYSLKGNFVSIHLEESCLLGV